MKAATVSELKEELKHQSAAQLLELCLRLSRFKKENKEMLTYLLFEAHDEQAYVESVKDFINRQFAEIPKSNSFYLMKKSLRKILRHTNKYIRYTGSKEVEIQLLIHYLSKLQDSGIPVLKSVVLTNMYGTQLKKIKSILPALHEDLQYDYNLQVRNLMLI
jgi:hypothetical protein